MRFILSTCWLVGAGGGWTLALAGLSAGARGVSPLVDLVIVGGAASWVGMLWTALRPGLSPNIWQKVLAALSWLMPITLLILRDDFSLNFILLSIASAACVTMIVVIYPSQSYTPSLAVDQRLEVHLAKVAEAAKKGGEKSEGGVEAALSASPTSAASPVGALSAGSQVAPGESSNNAASSGTSGPGFSGLDEGLRAALLKEGVPESVLESALGRLGHGQQAAAAEVVAAGNLPSAAREASLSGPEPLEQDFETGPIAEELLTANLHQASDSELEQISDQVDAAVYEASAAPRDQALAPRPEPVEVVRSRKRNDADPSPWGVVQSVRKGTVGKLDKHSASTEDRG